MKKVIKYHVFTDLVEDIIMDPRLSDEEIFHRIGFRYEMVRDVKSDRLIEQLVEAWRDKK